jgi:hypothetical protein
MAAASLLFLNSCEKYTEKTFSTTLSFDFDVEQLEDVGAYTVDLSGLADVLASNEDLRKNQDKIKDFKLIRVRYKVYEYYNDPATAFSGFIGFGNKSAASPGVSYSLENVSLQASMDNAEPQTMNFTSNDIERIEDYLLNTKGLTLYMDGTLSQTPAKFKLNLQVDVDAIADVLK